MLHGLAAHQSLDDLLAVSGTDQRSPGSMYTVGGSHCVVRLTRDAGVAIDHDQTGAEKPDAKSDQGLVTPGAKRMAVR